MSRMTTSRASLSWAMPAMRRACSSGARARMLAVVEAKACDQLRHRPRDKPVDRLAARDAVPDLTRRDRPGVDLEEQHALRPLQLGEHVVEPHARISRPRRNGEPRALQHFFR